MLPKEARLVILGLAGVFLFFPLFAWTAFEAGRRFGPMGGMIPVFGLGVVCLLVYGFDAGRRHWIERKKERTQATQCTCGAVQVVSSREVARGG